jgi:hypothetical protein
MMFDLLSYNANIHRFVETTKAGGFHQAGGSHNVTQLRLYVCELFL